MVTGCDVEIHGDLINKEKKVNGAEQRAISGV